MKQTLRSLLLGGLTTVAGWNSTAWADTVQLYPTLDTSIYSESENSNALGELFAGEAAFGAGFGLRRALIQFDIAGNIPAGSIINSVTLSLTLTRNGPAGSPLFELRPLLAAWGEGTSTGPGYGGAPTAGDATWKYRVYNSSLWTTPGGTFGPTSGTAIIGTSVGSSYVFASQSGMVANVQGWLDAPASDSGWIIKAASENPGNITAKGFGSSESPLAQRPLLTVDFTPVPEPSAYGLLVAAGVMALARRLRAGHG